MTDFGKMDRIKAFNLMFNEKSLGSAIMETRLFVFK